MRSRHLPLTVLALAVAVIAGPPGIAAASSSPLTSVGVLLLVPQDPTNTGLIVSGTLPSTTALPATVSLALPSGLQVQWAGELLGGDPLNDPTAKYTTRRQGAWDVHDLTLTKARIGQIEAAYPSAVTVSDGITTATFQWTAPEAIKSVALSIRIPSGATLQSTAGGLVAGPASSSEVPYNVTVADVKPGQTLTATVVYKQAAGSASASSSVSAGTAATNSAPVGGATSNAPVASSPSPLIIALVLVFLISWTLYALMEVRRRETAAHSATTDRATPATTKSSTSKAVGAKTSATKTVAKATSVKPAGTKAARKKDS